jgi:hypothetical protein
MNIKLKQVVKYNGHSLSANGSVNFDLKAGYDELGNTIQLFQLLNNDVKIKARIAGAKPMMLGMFRIKQIVIDGDGESKIRFNGLNDYIEMDNLNLLPLNSDDAKNFVVMYEAEVEVEEESEEE